MNSTFLSNTIQTWIDRHRHDHKEWFALADELSELGHEMIPALQIPAGNVQVTLTALLFLRGLSNIQAVILLTERGMTPEARLLARSCFETVFYLGAVRKDTGVRDRLIKDDAYRRNGIAKGILQHSEMAELKPEIKEKLIQFQRQLQESDLGIAGFPIWEAADKAGLKPIYDTYYRGLSNDSAHPSISSLNHYVNVDAHGSMDALKWGPGVSNIADTLEQACVAALHLLVLGKEIVRSAEIDELLAKHWSEYKRLAEKRTT
jgi:hypothetical protein